MNNDEIDPLPSSADSQLVEAVREFQAAVDAGRPPDRASFLARHPDVAGELADCLDGLCLLHDLAPTESTAGIGMPIGDYRLIREVGRGA